MSGARVANIAPGQRSMSSVVSAFSGIGLKHSSDRDHRAATKDSPFEKPWLRGSGASLCYPASCVTDVNRGRPLR
jgi:hypothetical protein